VTANKNTQDKKLLSAQHLVDLSSFVISYYVMCAFQYLRAIAMKNNKRKNNKGGEK
jgi:hypothetical protein